MKARIRTPRIRDAEGRFIKVRKNGKHAIDAASTIRVPATTMRSYLRPQAAYRGWMMPSVAAMTPRMIETILRGALAGSHVQQWDLFDLMLDTWPELAACKQELLYGITRRELQFDPYKEEDEEPTPNAIEREKLVTEALRNMQPSAAAGEEGIDGTIENIMDAWFRGISVSEVLWYTTDTVNQGLITAPRCTKFADPIAYAFDEDGSLGLTDQPPYSDTSRIYQPKQMVRPFPDYKFLIAMHKAKSGSPIGGALLRPLAWWWCAANFSSDWLLNLAQVFGLPFRWANYAASAPDETVNAVCNMLQNMGSAGWAAFPEGTSLELKEASKGGDATPQGDLLSRADAYVRLLILGQTMTGNTLASGRGGQSFGTVEAQLKSDRLDAASFFVANVFNRQLIPYILALNYGNSSEPPTCRFLKETEGTFQDAQRDQILAGLGLPIPFSHLRHKYGIPEATNDEPVTEPPPKPIAPSSVSAGPKGTRPLGEPSRNGSPNPRQVQSRLAEISAISDDAIFAAELERLANEAYYQPIPHSEAALPEIPPQVINLNVEAAQAAQAAAPTRKSFTITRPDGVVIEGEINQENNITWHQHFVQQEKKALLDAVVAHTWKAALYTSSATIDASTPAYTTTNEVASSGGYTAGGMTLGSAVTGSGSGTAWMDFADVTWTTATFVAHYMLIYDSTDSNRAYAVIDFGSDKTGQGGDFTFVMPAADASNAIIRI